MNGREKLHGSKRTAVLVVHGMGLQRPLDTVRGIVDAVWLDGSTSGSAKKIWIHPERSGNDIDLRVITTGTVPGTDRRRVDFHELYWAHLMSETRALAVLQWLFELARKGPRLKPDIQAVWWGGAVFLELLVFSVSLLAIKAIQMFTGVHDDPRPLLVAPILMFVILGVSALVLSMNYGAYRLVKWSGLLTVVLVFLVALAFITGALRFAVLFTPLIVAAIATGFLMGMWGLVALVVTYGLSFVFELLLHLIGWVTGMDLTLEWLPWTLSSKWCEVAAWVIVATYLIINAAFLQPYLGDAARYFRDAPSNVAVRREIRRQAVDALEALHRSGLYDRIVVVAHSLGTVVAYDMLRAYFGRIAPDLPTQAMDLGSSEDDDYRKLLDEVDSMQPGTIDPESLRAKARKIVWHMACIVDAGQAARAAAQSADQDDGPKAWLVTDFVTLGSPLTHAHYLMCRVTNRAVLQAHHASLLRRLWLSLKGASEDDLRDDFIRRVDEREFPICPPKRSDGDGLLLFFHQRSGTHWFHNGALFGLTRWTNLYFPASELFQGDAVGGALHPVFGDNSPAGAIFDVEVYTRAKMPGVADFFTHVSYWDIDRPGGHMAPHIVILRNAIDLADKGLPNSKQTLMA
jgi:hypothetical protein